MNYDDLMRMFVSLSKKTCVDNDIAQKIYFHILMGAYFNKIKINWGQGKKDLKLHTLWVQPSRTGKDQLNKYIHSLAKLINLRSIYGSDITSDASFIGTIDSEAKKFNMQHNLSLENLSHENDKGDVFEYKDPIIKGDLGHSDLLIISEFKIFFQLGERGEKLLTVIQPALDCPSLIRKKMRDIEFLDYESDSTFVMTTIPFKKMNESILEQGFFQRLLIFIKRMTISEVRDMRKKAFTVLSNIDLEKFDRELQELANNILKINNDVKLIKIRPEAHNVINTIIDRFFDDIENFVTGSEASAATSFTNSVQDALLKCAAHVALIEGRTEITVKDINKVYFNVVKPFRDCIINEIEADQDPEEALREKGYFAFVKNILEKEKEIPKMTLVELFKNKFNCSKSTSLRRIDNLHLRNFIVIDEEVDENTRKFVRLKG